MKRIITLLATLVIASVAYAQTDTPVVFDTQGDNLGISIAGFNISLGEDDRSSNAQKPKRVSTNFAGISYGLNVLTNEPNYGNWTDEPNFMTDDIGAGRLGIEAMGIQVSLDRKGNVFFKASLNVSIDMYRFKRAMTLINEDGGALMPEPISGVVKKSKMVTTYVGVGAGFGFKLSRSVKLTLDFNVDALTGSYVKYKNPSKTKYDIAGFNNIRYRAGAAISLRDFGIYADYSLTPLFREGVGNDGRVLSIGIRVGF
ncbi:MAG: hypothetical protein E7115_03415 [Bacteroidales bacterium]|nr:hypothetical protein [Bacteroidales bacterium]